MNETVEIRFTYRGKTYGEGIKWQVPSEFGKGILRLTKSGFRTLGKLYNDASVERFLESCRCEIAPELGKVIIEEVLRLRKETW